MTTQPTQPQTLEVNQVIQCDGYRLVVTAVKQDETKENEAIIKALKKINGTKWVGNTIHDNIDKCLVAINLSSCNSGWYNPKAKRIPGLAGIYMINQDGSIFCEARVLKESQNQYRIEYLTKEGWNQFEQLFCELTAAKQAKNEVEPIQPEPVESPLQTELKNKSKITLSTLKSFIKKADKLFVLGISSFDGMEDGVRFHKNPELIPVAKDDAIGHGGVWCVGSSRDMLKYYETDTHFGIEVYNCCGCGVLLAKK